MFDVTMEAANSWHGMSSEAVLERLGARSSGLSTDEAHERLDESGPNVLRRAKSKGPLELLRRQVVNTLPMVLLGAAILASASGRTTDGVVVIAVIVMNTIIGLIQEFRAEHAIEALARLASEEVRTLRDGIRSSMPAAELVPGDVVLLQAGDHVPADMRTLSLRGLRVNEAALTGESIPAETTKIETPLTRALRKFSDTLTLAIGVVANVVNGSRRGRSTGSSRGSAPGRQRSCSAGSSPSSPRAWRSW